MRREPIYHSTYTGKPPDEPAILGVALNEVFVPLLTRQFPEIVDFYLPPEGCSYRLAVASMRKAYPGHAKRVMFGIWSFLRQFMYTKFIVVVDDDIDIRDWKEVIWAITTRVDPARDTLIAENTPIDYLDFASPVSGLGSKMGIDATNKWPGETTRKWGTPIAMDAAVKQRVDELWASLGTLACPTASPTKPAPTCSSTPDNPVDWHPWGEEALRLAREQNKPILLSVGYSACHWCHVMAHESFEDPAVAAVMNRLFVNIKVDREERPDIDQIYQTAHQMLTQRAGGWPLTMFLAPDQKPFFGGTYFPKTARYNLPGFGELLRACRAGVPRAGRGHRRAERGAASRCSGRRCPRLRRLPPASTRRRSMPRWTQLKADLRSSAWRLGGAPKFPHPAELELCLREGRCAATRRRSGWPCSRWRRWRRAASTTSSAAASAATAWTSTG